MKGNCFPPAEGERVWSCLKKYRGRHPNVLIEKSSCLNVCKMGFGPILHVEDRENGIVRYNLHAMDAEDAIQGVEEIMNTHVFPNDGAPVQEFLDNWNAQNME